MTRWQSGKPTWDQRRGGHQCIIGSDKSAINSTPPHYHQSLSSKTKVSLRDESPNQCVSITGRNWSPSDLWGWVMWNPLQVSPRGPDKIKDKTPEKSLYRSVATRYDRGVKVWAECETLWTEDKSFNVWALMRRPYAGMLLPPILTKCLKTSFYKSRVPISILA